MNQKKLIGLTVTGLMAAGLNIASVQAERGERGNGNGDIATVVERIFNHLDSDESGTISFAEFVAPKLVKAEKKFITLDTDEDGLLTLEEMQAGHTAPDDSIDRDAIRQCVADSLGVDLPERMTGEERFAAVDTNGDGFLDWDEYTAGVTAKAQTKFDHIDTNGDGELNNGEVTSALASRKDIRQARRTCRQEQEAVNDLLGD